MATDRDEIGAAGWAGADEMARLAFVTRAIHEGVVLIDADARIRWANDAFVRMTGYSLAEVVGRPRLELVQGPFTRTQRFARLQRTMAELGELSTEFVDRTRSGRPYWVRMEVRPVLVDGRVAGQIGLERDITERRRAEVHSAALLCRAQTLTEALRGEKHLLSSVLGTIPQLVWWKDLGLRYEGCNAGFLAARGLSSVAEVLGLREDQLSADDGWGAQLARIEARVLESGRPLANAQLRWSPSAGSAGPGRSGVDDQPGSSRVLTVDVLPRMERGVLTGLIGVGTDVTVLTTMEQQLCRARRLEAIGELAAGVAHEINTPVQFVSDNTRFVAQSFATIMDGLREISRLVVPRPATELPECWDRLIALLDAVDLDFVAGEIPSALTQSLEGLERVSQIVRAMKDFSHPGTELVLADLNQLVESTVQVCRNEWKYVAGLTLELDPGMGEVPCYEGELKQAVLNILVNAAQAIDERRHREGTEELGMLRVATQRVGDEARIVVADDGIGMDEATRQRIFDPFFTTKAVGKGTGQGLSLAYATMSKHGGRIDVSSQPMRGATFTLSWPCSLLDRSPVDDGPDQGEVVGAGGAA